jgi:hypothetical protein
MMNHRLMIAVCLSLAAGFVFLVFSVFALEPAQGHPAQGAAAQPLYLPLITRPYDFLQPANPLNLSVRLDMDHSSERRYSAGLEGANRAPLPISGGVISTTAVDGTIFTLTIPPEALYTDTQITLIPLAAIDGQPLGGLAGAGVQLEPAGLEFFYPVTLTIAPAVSIPITAELSLAYQGDGLDFHRYPLSLQHPYPQVVFHLTHFSGLAYLGPGISLPISPGRASPAGRTAENPIPADAEAQLKQTQHDLFQMERQALLLGQPGDPNFLHKVLSIMETYYQQVVFPLIKAAETECSVAEEGGAFRVALGWERDVQLLGLADSFQTESNQISTSFQKALSNCWNKTTQPCLNWHDPDQVQHMLQIARSAALLGFDEGTFDPDNLIECACNSNFEMVTAYQADVNMSFYRSIEGNVGTRDYASVTIDRSAQVQFSLAQITVGANGIIWSFFGNPSGSASLSDSAHYVSPPWTDIRPAASGSLIRSANSTLYLDTTLCTFDLSLDVVAQITDDSGFGSPMIMDQTVLFLWEENFNAATPDALHTPISGGGAYPMKYVQANDYMLYGNTFAASYLTTILGFSASPGTGEAAFTLVPQP